MKISKQTLPYIASDFISASVVWLLFNSLRYQAVAIFEGFNSLMDYMTFFPVWSGQILVPFFWLIIYYFSGYYNQPFGKSRVSEFITTFFSTLVGVVLLFFLMILNDLPPSFHVYYTMFISLFGLNFFLTYIPRLCITLYRRAKIRNREWALNILIIGTGNRAKKIAEKLYNLGYNIAGFVKESDDANVCVNEFELLGIRDELTELISKYSIKELVVAPETHKENYLLDILYPLYQYKLPVKVLADSINVFSKVNIKTIHGAPLVDINSNRFSYAEENIKHFADKVIAILVLIIISPLYVYIAYKVKRESTGSVIYKQERIGYMGKPFMMYKFRTMYEGAEENGPLLSKEDDSRITPFGNFMRKYRLDELPQFWNVLKGEMSLVGPRPERKFFIDQIVKEAPYYYLIHNVRPGITSLGMVKYGYARNVDEMIDRLAYDVLYYENMSLLFDITILLYTIRTVVTGKGI